MPARRYFTPYFAGQSLCWGGGVGHAGTDASGAPSWQSPGQKPAASQWAPCGTGPVFANWPFAHTAWVLCIMPRSS